MLPVSNDTLLRVVRRRGSPRIVPPTVIGVDDWAWRRNHRYGTLICDLERRRTIALLPDREPATTQAWLEQQPQVSIVARDRASGNALAVSKALPAATQVADRWHLMENATRAFLDAVRKSMRQIRTAVGATSIDPALLTATALLHHALGRDLRIPTMRSIAWPRRASPSRRSFAGPATAEGWCAKSSEVRGRKSSGQGKVTWNCIFPGSTSNGRQDIAMVPNFGGGSGRRVSKARYALSRNERPAGAGPTRWE